MARERVEWGGRKWYCNRKDGYFRSRGGKLLHRAVWEDVHGPLPPGHHVHHRNEDRSDNGIDNLQALTPSEHLRQHRPRGAAGWDAGTRSAAAAVQWTERDPRALRCDGCGRDFASTGQRARFCSNACRAAHRRRSGADDVSRVCPACGGVFAVNRYSPTRHCSSSCGQRRTADHAPSGLQPRG